MKNCIKSAKAMSRGVFWIIDDELLAFPFIENSLEGVAKSGNTYNHKKLWNKVKPHGCSKPYNYYPRGRVDISNKGNPIIYMNPNISNEFIDLIKSRFGLSDEPIIRYDNSQHYKCYLDADWRKD